MHVGETEKKRRCRDTRCSYGPDNGPFIRHCIPGTLIVSLKPDNLRGYETAPPSSFSYLVLPFPFWHPFVYRLPYWQGLIKGEQKMSKEERRCLKVKTNVFRKIVSYPWKMEHLVRGIIHFQDFQIRKIDRCKSMKNGRATILEDNKNHRYEASNSKVRDSRALSRGRGTAAINMIQITISICWRARFKSREFWRKTNEPRQEEGRTDRPAGDLRKSLNDVSLNYERYRGRGPPI